MRIFKTKLFDQWAHKSDLSDEILCTAVHDIEAGQYEANLGGYLYKKRIAIPGKGKSGGLRTILAFRKDDKAFFVYGFAKNKQANISQDELSVYKELAKLLLAFNDAEINQALSSKAITEITENG